MLSVQMLRAARAIYIDGYVFDELPSSIVAPALKQAQRAGASVFFDPGPRGSTGQEGPGCTALTAMLDIADVVLLTEVGH